MLAAHMEIMEIKKRNEELKKSDDVRSGPPPSLPEINAERNTPIPHIKTCRNKYLGGRSSEIATPQPPKTTPKSLKTTSSTHCIEYQGGVDQLDDILSIPTIIGPIGQILMEL